MEQAASEKGNTREPKSCFVFNFNFDSLVVVKNGQGTHAGTYLKVKTWSGNTKGGSITVLLTSCLTDF